MGRITDQRHPRRDVAPRMLAAERVEGRAALDFQRPQNPAGGLRRRSPADRAVTWWPSSPHPSLRSTQVTPVLRAAQGQDRQGSAAPQPLAHGSAMRAVDAARPWSGPAGRRPSGRPDPGSARAPGRRARPRRPPEAPDTANPPERASMASPTRLWLATSPCRRASSPARVRNASSKAARRLACSTPTPNGPLPCCSLS